MLKFFKESKNLINKIAEQLTKDQEQANQLSKCVCNDINEHKKRMAERRKNFSLIRNK